jgi:hypothetical protein
MPVGFVARFVRYAESMEVFGPDLGMPHTKAMGGGLFELRLKAAEGIAGSSTARSLASESSSCTSSSRRRTRHLERSWKSPANG